MTRRGTRPERRNAAAAAQAASAAAGAVQTVVPSAPASNGTATTPAEASRRGNGARPTPGRIVSFLSDSHTPRPKLALPPVVEVSPAADAPADASPSPAAPQAPAGTASSSGAAGAAGAPPAPPPAPPAGAPPSGYAPAGATQATANYAVENAEEMRRRDKERDEQRFRSIRGPQIQGDTDLLHVWSDLVRSRRFDPRGGTIWLTRLDKIRKYTLEIMGQRATYTYEGEFPDRALYEAAEADRRYPDEAEEFDGRIRMATPDGQYVEVGSGKLFLPPRKGAQPQAAQQGAMYNPYAPPPWYPFTPPPQGGPQGAPPWGGWAMPPWMMGAWGAPPWAQQSGWGAPPWAQAVPLGTPPPDVANNPGMLQLWIEMQKTQTQTQSNQQIKQMEMMFELWKMQRGNDKGSNESDFDKFGKFMGMMKGMKEFVGGGEGGGGISIIDHNGKTFVTKPDGSLDKEMSIGLTVADGVGRGVSSLRSAWAARRAQQTTNGAGGAASGGAANGASSTPRPKGT